MAWPLEVTLLTRVPEAQIVKLYADGAPPPEGKAGTGPLLYAIRRDGRSVLFWPPATTDYDLLTKRSPL